MKQFLNVVNLGFLLFALRLIALGASLGDAVAMFAFAALYGWQLYMNHKEVEKYNQAFEENVKIEFEKAAKELSNIKTVMGAINIGQTYKSSPLTGSRLNGQGKAV